MPRYLLLNHGTGQAELWPPYLEKLQQGQHLIGGSALNPGIALQGGNLSGAQTATLTGYLVIEADSWEAAQAIARESPVHQSGGSVELFPLIRS